MVFILVIVSLLSALFFILSLIAIPLVIVRLPSDFFIRFTREKQPARRGLRKILLYPLSQVSGVILIAAGIAMLVLPGQGLLTILFGLLILDFPGKRRLVRRLLCLRQIRTGLNWVRRKAHKEPLLMP
ncbi:MAG: hypothetical protein JW795_09685 [Chitinivibrionales bacterium]|nr:hypothetical protein [Chitinivibrionales bacterium]